MTGTERPRPNKTYPLFFLVIFIAFLFTSGCAINNVQVHRPDLLNKDKKMFIYGHADAADIYSTVKKNLLKLGFDVVEEKGEAELAADYNYECGWDVIHYTCRKFNLFVTDTSSKEIVFQSKFWGDTPFSARYLIDNMFDKLKKELDKTMTRPHNPRDSRSSVR